MMNWAGLPLKKSLCAFLCVCSVQPTFNSVPGKKSRLHIRILALGERCRRHVKSSSAPAELRGGYTNIYISGRLTSRHMLLDTQISKGSCMYLERGHYNKFSVAADEDDALPVPAFLCLQ